MRSGDRPQSDMVLNLVALGSLRALRSDGRLAWAARGKVGGTSTFYSFPHAEVALQSRAAGRCALMQGNYVWILQQSSASSF